ncbi:MAG: sigma-70 family RNA polymerase sigma factor [Ignavibacteria bacterium]
MSAKDQNDNVSKLTDHLFRREAGKMVSVLTKIFGTKNLETAEDVVQQTFIDAIELWMLKGIPDNPSAWLFRVAKNKAIDVIRRNKHSLQYDFNDSERILLKSEYTLASKMENFWKEELVKDDMLGMMFACCHPEVSAESQITLILKTLCGFSTAEISKAFLTSEDTVSKRLYRTKEFFRKNKIKLEIPSSDQIRIRTEAVLNAIYLLFNEGYNSTHSEELIRQDLIDESMLLCRLLTENPNTQLPETYALTALICFHASRSPGRLSAEGEIILLPMQDRSKWDKDLISIGIEYMDKASSGNSVSTYHIEAAIAFEHCAAGSFEKTNWKRILELYEWLCKISPSPVAELSKAAVVMQMHGASEALKILENILDKKKIEEFYLYHSLLGEIYSRMNDNRKAKHSFENAARLTRSSKEKKLLDEKIIALIN